MTTTQTTISHLREIAVTEITASDLASEVSANDPEGIGTRDDVVAYAFVYAGGQRGDAVLFRDTTRLGVCWGADAVWGDVPFGLDPDDLDAVEREIIASADDEDWAR